ncbi:MAG: orotate phosphoribosyltransferase [Gemmatimonadaceae bacterium]|nr:orotate phosphoribosyltransferase [Gemmatimonadaceae bacterium]
MTERAQLVELLKKKSVRFGAFTLASGATSDLYIDARLTTMSPEGLALIGPLALSTIRRMRWNADSIGGLTLGADPIAYAASFASTMSPPLLRAFTVRKEPKEHGTRKLIEGPFKPGDRVVVVEDVVTSGASALRAIDAVREAGGEVVGVVALVDRHEGGTEKIKTAGYSLITLVEGEELRAR